MSSWVMTSAGQYLHSWSMLCWSMDLDEATTSRFEAVIGGFSPGLNFEVSRVARNTATALMNSASASKA
ncbi:hypothetical protein D3C85_1605400 [compost metagenome]